MRNRYAVTLCAFLLFCIICVALFNWIIDPLGIWARQEKPYAAQLYTFIHKIENVKRLKPEAIITGTSRADICLDPGPGQFGGIAPYNFALPSASVHEQRMTLEFAQAVHPLKKALITLDFFAFDARKKDTPEYDATRLAPESLTPFRAFIDTYGPLLSVNTLQASFKQLQFARQPDRYSYPKKNGAKEPVDYDYIAKEAGAGWAFRRERFTNPDDSKATRAIGSAAMNHFRAMVDFAYEHDIDARFVIMPLHESYFDMLRETGQDDFMDKWEQMLRKVIHDASMKHNKPAYRLFDFSFLREYATEKIPPPEDKTTVMRWFWDPGHCKAELGDIVLRKALAGE